ncbi:MAG: endolytic transglycosylase MltG [Oscillospiraceae bacterium]|nr:endolytic transglycosylase MltG [Oscillospiraceae bacterium]
MNNKFKINSVAFLSIFIILISSLLSWGIIEVAKDILGLKKNEISSEVVIPKGSSTGKIASILKNNKIIKYPIVFKVYSKLTKVDNTYREGKYVLSSTMSYSDIIYYFQNMTAREDVVKVTIPEGYTVNQIASLLKEKGVCEKKQDFLDAINNEKYKSEALDQVEDNKLICFKSEGYLFPDTYEFILKDKPKHLIEIMTQNFDKKVLGELRQDIDKSELSLSEIITLASIVQKESTSADVMKKVSSVFFNRLNNPREYLRLESDVTILYIESDIKPNLEMKNQEMYDSYNTYVCKGLPVGPICNPGLDAIKSVLEPEDTDYYFFLTDINNDYYWATNFSQHNNNIYKASRLGAVKGLKTD